MPAQRVTRVKPSPTLAMNAKANEMKARGEDVVNFGVGEPDFDTPDNVKEAAIKAIRDGFTKYTAAAGTPELKAAVIEKFERDNALKYSPEEVIVSCGAKHSLYNIAQAILSPGDEVVIHSPYWVSYPAQTLLNDAVPVIVNTFERDSFLLQPEALDAAITERTRAVIINSPSNPTGMLYDRRTLEGLAEVAVRRGIYVISDEVYEHILYDGAEHVSIASLGPEIKKQTIVVNAVSKSHCMTGWRIGYAAGPADVVRAMSKVQSQSTSNPASISQAAAVEALTGPQDFLGPMLKEFSRRREYLVGELNAMAGVSCLMPQGAFYAFPNVSGAYGGKVANSTDLAMYLLQEAKVALVPGEAFGDDDYIRISYATSMEQIKKAVGRINSALDKLGA